MKNFIASITMIAAVLVGEAFGECGWVLWESVTEHPDRGKGKFWKIIDSYTTRSACDEEQAMQMRDTREGFKESDTLEISKNEMQITSRKLKNGLLVTTWRFMCLPGSLDPRH